jgi:hypothetical protein
MIFILIFFVDSSFSTNDPYKSFDINLIDANDKEIYSVYLDFSNIRRDVTI